ncbi:MAG: hypothetical protein ACOCP4_07695 [Candidatus Woesearchaeota archaeon]
MYYKKCTKCDKKSYSSYKEKEWECPYCGENLTNEKARIERRQLNGKKS